MLPGLQTEPLAQAPRSCWPIIHARAVSNFVSTAARAWFSSPPHNPLPIEHLCHLSPCQSSKLPPQGCDALGGWQPDHSTTHTIPSSARFHQAGVSWPGNPRRSKKLECPTMARRHRNRLLPSCIVERAPTARLMRIQRHAADCPFSA
jgi:hypothetical protein